MSSKKIVLVFGSTGWVGGKVVNLLLQRSDVTVKAFARPSSDQQSLIEKGATIVEGNLLEKDSLDTAFQPSAHLGRPVDVVIYCAATYTARQKGDSEAQEMEAFHNVVDAAKAANVKRFVLASIIAAEKATSVPHFHDKFLQEQYLREVALPFISVRAGIFLDQAPQNDMLWTSLKKNFVPVVIHRVDAKMHFVHSDDFARALCRAALDIPTDNVPFKILNIAAEPQASWEDVAAEFSRQLGRPITAQAPVPGLSILMPIAGVFSPVAHDMTLMFQFIDSDKYVVDDWTESKKYLGDPPTLWDTVAKYIAAQIAVGHDLSEEPPGMFKKLLQKLSFES
jgi:nucleoside-diphosphate-sugar epimerase